MGCVEGRHLGRDRPRSPRHHAWPCKPRLIAGGARPVNPWCCCVPDRLPAVWYGPAGPIRQSGCRVHVARAARCHSANGPGRAARTRKPNSGHIGTISITIRVRRAGRNAMKPRIHCVLTGHPRLWPGTGGAGVMGVCCRVHIAAYPVPQGTDLSRPARSSSGHGCWDGMVGG
jgi:hypothetical protein